MNKIKTKFKNNIFPKWVVFMLLFLITINWTFGSQFNFLNEKKDSDKESAKSKEESRKNNITVKSKASPSSYKDYKTISADKDLIFYMPFEKGMEPVDLKLRSSKKGDVSIVQGYNGKGLKVSGKDSTISFKGINSKLESGTIMFWVKPAWKSKQPPGHFVFAKLKDNKRNCLVDFYRAGGTERTLLQCRIQNNEKEYTIDKQGRDTFNNKWAHIAITWNPEKGLFVYKNGKVIISDSKSWDPSNIIVDQYIIKSRSNLSCILDEIYLYKRELSKDAIKTICMGVGGNSFSNPTSLNPVLYASFENKKSAKFKNQLLAGKIGSSVTYAQGLAGKGIIIKRYAYDQVGALHYDNIAPFSDSSTMSFYFIPSWDGNDSKRHELFHFSAKEKTFSLVKTVNNNLSLTLNLSSKENFSIPCNFKKNTGYDICVVTDLKQKIIKLFINNKLNKWPIKNSSGLTGLTGDLWIGSAKSIDRYGGTPAEGLFDELKIFDKALTDKEVENINKEDSTFNGFKIIDTNKLLKIDTSVKWDKLLNLKDKICYYYNSQKTDFPKQAGKLKKGNLFVKKNEKSLSGSINSWFKLKNNFDDDKWSPFMQVKGDSFGFTVNYNITAKKIGIIFNNTSKKKFLDCENIKINPEEWHLLSVVWDDENLYVYIDATYQCVYRNFRNEWQAIETIKYSTEKSQIEEITAFKKKLDKKDLIMVFNAGINKKEISKKIGTHEQNFWDLKDAAKEKTSTREKICLHGYWRLFPTDKNQIIPPDSRDLYYSKLPGRWLSYHYYKIFNSGLSPIDNKTSKKLQKQLSAWYTRYIKLPGNFKGEKLFLTIDYMGATSSRIYINNKLVQTTSEPGRNGAGVMKKIVTDISDFSNESDLKIDIFLYFEKHGARGDVQGISCDYIYLHKTNSKIFIKDTFIKTSVKKKKIDLDLDICNFERTKDTNLKIIADIYQKNDNKLVKSSGEMPIVFQGKDIENIKLSFNWNNPVYWDVFNPHLYKMRIKILKDGKVVDESYNNIFGFREFEIKEADFYINNKKTHFSYHSSAHGGVFVRYQYLYCREDTIGNLINKIKDSGYNMASCEIYWELNTHRWHQGESPSYIRTVLNKCDELGLYMILWAPFYSDDMDPETYSDEVRNHIRSFANHPSVIMYLPTFNTCGYAYTMHPRSTSDMKYKSSSIKKINEALTSDKIIQHHDPTRDIFHNYSGNMYHIYSTMHYMSLGIPLQEREDWPSHWAETKKMPFMPSELGLPFRQQLNDFDGPELNQTKFLAVEHCARYGGNTVYKEVNKPALRYKRTHNEFNSYFMDKNGNLTPFMKKFKNLFIEKNIKAWRGYGVSGLGLFGEDAWFFTRKINGYYLPGKMKYKNIKTPGLKPDTVFIPNRRLFLDKPLSDSAKVFKKYLQPVLAFIGGKKGHFNRKDHSYFAGEKIEKQIIIINDTMNDLPVEATLSLNNSKNKIINTIDFKTTVIPGEVKKIPFVFNAPNVEKREEYTINAAFSKNGKIFEKDLFAIQLFPREKNNSKNFMPALFDPVGKTESVLKKAGLKYKKINSIEELGSLKSLIIGAGVLAIQADSFLINLEKRGYLDRGLNILVFEQRNCNFANLIFEQTRQRYVYINNKNHFLLQGLEENDFTNWKGASDIIEPYPMPTPEIKKSPHYPFAKWNWGNDGIVSTYVIRKPAFGNFNIILECGFDLMNTPLIEFNKGNSHIINCQLDVTSRYGKCPVATKITDNLYNYLEYLEKNKTIKNKTVVIANEKYKEILFDKLKIEATIESSVSELGKYSTIIIGGVTLNSADNEKIKSFIESGGNAIFLNDKDDPFSEKNFPFPVQKGKIYIFKDLKISDSKILEGLGNSDFYFRDIRGIDIFKIDGTTKVLENDTISVKKYGKGYCIISSIDSAILEPKTVILRNKKKYDSFIDKYIHQKGYRIIGQILKNCGVRAKMPKIFVSNFYQNNSKHTREIFVKLKNGWKFKIDPKDEGLENGWQKREFNDDAWEKIEVGRSWESQGFSMANPGFDYGNDKAWWKPGGKSYAPYDGFAWYRYHLVIPKKYQNKKIVLFFQKIDDCDWTYFNNTLVGKTDKSVPKFYGVKRAYSIPKNLIKFGEDNVISIRVLDVHGKGGLLAEPIQLELRELNQSTEKHETMYIKTMPEYDVNAYRMW